MSKGKLYGIGVGPGDPELLTLKAKRVIESSPILAKPVKKVGEDSTAFKIIEPVVDLSKVEVIDLLFGMTGNNGDYWEFGKVAGDRVIEYLDQGKDVSLITLGDVSIYSTFMYLEQYVRGKGYETEIIPGIPSFCGGAAVARIPLTLGDQCLAIVPSAKDNPMVEEALDKFDNVVVMKAGKSVDKILGQMKGRGMGPECMTVISNVGMPDEYVGPVRPGMEYGYFTTLIIKKSFEKVV
ncbi:MAG: precorrin-2 C(20)-methyltransferase [Candidatus Methanomethylophilaceae archaeon]|nr:precorrin-2 C(20)-methyltransferase [Candidatus Methanomethylophilaceae archaeon]